MAASERGLQLRCREGHFEMATFELQRQEGTMLVIATHSRALAARCARRLELRDGLCFAA